MSVEGLRGGNAFRQDENEISGAEKSRELGRERQGDHLAVAIGDEFRVQSASDIHDHDGYAVYAGRILGTDAEPIVPPVRVARCLGERLELIIERAACDRFRRERRIARRNRPKFDHRRGGNAWLRHDAPEPDQKAGCE
jgi:hypothetical protein